MSLPLRILKPLLFPLIGITLLFSLAFVPTFLVAPGLSSPEPIGAYLNGNFPSAIESEIQLTTPFTATGFSAILATAAEPASTRIHFAERGGGFYWLSSTGNGSDRTVFMNISGRVWTGQDSGVLGMAFHPDYNKSGNPNRNFFYVYYVTSDGTDEFIRLSRFTRNEGTNTADPNSESILIEQVLGPTLHRGGGLQFGNDGFLYLAIGDLGWTTQSQNITDRLSGGVLRIDVDKKGGSISHPVRRTLQSVGQGTTGDYYIPNDNPFLATNGSVFEEYYTLGCRNPHRMTIDRVTGNLYIGNVGSNSGDIREEVNLVAKGANFGWPYREGFADRPDLMARPTSIIGTETDPIHEYDHSGGNSWVLGGYVYRGTAIPGLYGKYIFADGGSRKVWALDISGNAPYTQKEEIANSNSTFYSFAEDQSGELYLTSNAVQKLTSVGNTTMGVAPGTYYVRARHSGKYLSVSGAGLANGASLVQWEYAAATNQQFVLENVAGGLSTLKAIHSGKVVDVESFRTTDASEVHQWTYNNTENQKWYVESAGGTYFRIRGLQSNLDLEVAGSSSANGANVQIGNREASNNFNQLWEFIPISGGGPIEPSVGIPQLLSQTGAFANLTTLEPNGGIIPYDMITALWSDGAEKYRWLAVPNDGAHNSTAENIVWSEEGEWGFPVGSVFIKHFEIQIDKRNVNSIRRLETRFLIHGETGYYALTYRWRPDGTDAELLEASFEDNLTITETDGSTRPQTWYYPSRSECFVCHTEASGRVLGPKTRHLNRDILYPSTGLVGNQVETYNHLGMFDQDVDVAEIANFLTASALEDQSASIEDRARSYLDVNCSSCHRPGGGTRSNWNALLSEDLAFASIVNGEVVEDLGIEGAKIIVPGDTAKSVLYQRLKQVGTGTAMPPLAKDVQHQEGVALIADWINSMPPNAGEVANGLMATYYDNIDFTNEAMRRIDRQINFNWDLGAPSPSMGENTFSIRWEGFIEVPTSGTYTFYLRSDDGVRLWIDNQMVIENWTVHAPTEDIGTIELEAGQRVPIKLDYFENGGHAVAELRWSSSEIEKQYVPESALFLEQGGTGLMATYYDNIDFTNEAMQRIDPVVDFSWGGGAPNAAMGVNTFSVRWKGFIEVPYSGTYTFYTASDDGVRLWVNGQQIIDDWRDHGVLENTGTISLTEGEMVPIQLDYYENGGGAVVKLSWSGNGIQKQIIPRTVLYPVGPDVNGVIAHWPLDFDASDAIGNAHGELQGGATLVEDFERGKVLAVANSEAHVLVNPKPQLQVGTEGKDFSIAFWINLTQSSTGEWRSIMHKGESNSQRTFAMWMRPSDNRIHYRITTDANGNEGGDSQTPLPVNQWSHIAYVKEGQSLKLYINGVVDHETTLAGSTISNNGNLYFGDTPWYPAAVSMMDDIRLYGYPISPSEIADLMLPPSCSDFIALDGEGLDIGSGGGQTYMVGTNNYVYKWNECARNWGLFAASPAASRIDVDGEGNPWITATDQKIYRWNGSAFQQLPGAAVEIGVSGNTVFVANADGNLYQFNGSSWTGFSKPAFVSRVDVREGQPWIVTQDNSVYQYLESNWLIQGEFQAKDISVSDKDGSIYVLSTTGEASVYEGSGAYKPLGASNGANISVGNEGNIWVVQTSNNLLRMLDCDAVGNTVASNGSCDSGTMLMETWPIAKWQWYFHHTNEVPIRTQPQATKLLTSFEVPSDVVTASDNGVRLRGYITPPLTGEYTFWISSVMASELWISPDEDPVKGNQICQVYTGVGYRRWTQRKGQQSAPITLEAGKRYYIEAFAKMRNAGSDHLSIGWQLPDGTLERPISGAYLSPYTGQEDAEAPSAPGTPVVTDLTSDGVSLKWPHATDNVGVAGYYIYQDGNSVPVDSVIQGDSVNVYGLGAASTHLFAVAAYDAEGNLSEQSQAVQVTTKEGCEKVAIYYDDFEDGTGIWNLTNSTSKWANRPDLATSGNYVVTMAGDSDTSFFETHAMDLERFEEISLDFTFHVYEYFYWSDVVYLQVSTDGGSSYRTIEHWDYRSGDLINNRQEYKRITFNGPFSNQTKIRFTILERNSRRNGYVHFDDVSIEGCAEEACETPQNLALGRTARQSSTYGNGVAALAVDGNLIGTSPWSADLQHTNNESQPWWEVDLAARSKIDSIRIYNRSDCCEERLKDFYVLVSD
ncbi:MAG: PA14 domain-containing protein, partial [Bacteroidota bacterium]